MGGMLILISLFISVILWSDLSSKLVWCVFGVTISLGLIKAMDDYKKALKSKSSDGIKSLVSVRICDKFYLYFFILII